MSLDVWVVAPPRPGEPKKPYRRRIAEIQPDGYYEYLSAFWPASSSTGRLIDLYDETHFEGANLEQLRSSLVRARAALEGHPETWEVHVGTQVHPVRRELHHTVRRGQMALLIESLLAGINEAEARKGRVVFEGD